MHLESDIHMVKKKLGQRSCKDSKVLENCLIEYLITNWV